jgi:DNA repair exonuclease SbcCD nuclease subunit
MKIIHTADIGLGAKFNGYGLAGDKLRAGLKMVFSKIIDYTINEKADLLIIAGNLFDNLEISRNLQDHIAAELGRLGQIPAVIIPGTNDKYTDGSFWNAWQSLHEQGNIHTLTNPYKSHVIIENLDLAVYGIFPSAAPAKPSEKAHNPVRQQTTYHIGVMCSSIDMAKPALDKAGLKFDYIALGGEKSFADLSPSGLPAAFPGSPEKLGFDHTGGGIVKVEIDSQKKVTIEQVRLGNFVWKTEEIQAKEIINNDDLINRIMSIAGSESANTVMQIKLTGLALFEADLSPEYVSEQLKTEFLYLDIIDNMKVLPENVSEVKVSEKTLLGQYLKVMANELSAADETAKPRLEKSVKVGLALLQGREIW